MSERTVKAHELVGRYNLGAGPVASRRSRARTAGDSGRSCPTTRTGLASDPTRLQLRLQSSP
jgi:hypothetical protein